MVVRKCYKLSMRTTKGRPYDTNIRLAIDIVFSCGRPKVAPTTLLQTGSGYYTCIWRLIKNYYKKEVVKLENKKTGFFSNLKSKLSKTRSSIAEKVDVVLNTFKKVDEELFEELEEALITADIGVNTTMLIVEELRKEAVQRRIKDSMELKSLLKEIIRNIMHEERSGLNINQKPSVILVIGVNGVGKTTSIGKLAYKLKNEGKKVLVAAADTFRAAAIDQLEVWSNKAVWIWLSIRKGLTPQRLYLIQYRLQNRVKQM